MKPDMFTQLMTDLSSRVPTQVMIGVVALKLKQELQTLKPENKYFEAILRVSKRMEVQDYGSALFCATLSTILVSAFKSEPKDGITVDQTMMAVRQVIEVLDEAEFTGDHLWQLFKSKDFVDSSPGRLIRILLEAEASDLRNYKVAFDCL